MLPAALARAIRLPLLTPEQFTPTKWDDTSIKAKFGNHLLRFVAEDFPEHMFTQKFYERLSNTCGHIAHFNKIGFWDEFFRTRATKIEFIEQTMGHPCYGDPAWTYSDVERIIRARLKLSGLLDWHKRLLAQENEARDRAEYHRLAQKFAPAPARNEPMPPEDQAQTTRDPYAPATGIVEPPAHTSTRNLVEQADLFAGL